MGLYNSIDHDELYSCFRTPCVHISDTTGIGDGVIIRFAEFYIKIYDDPDDFAYKIYHYRYGNPNPFRFDHIKSQDLKKWAKSLNM